LRLRPGEARVGKAAVCAVGRLGLETGDREAPATGSVIFVHQSDCHPLSFAFRFTRSASSSLSQQTAQGCSPPTLSLRSLLRLRPRPRPRPRSRRPRPRHRSPVRMLFQGKSRLQLGGYPLRPASRESTAALGFTSIAPSVNDAVLDCSVAPSGGSRRAGKSETLDPDWFGLSSESEPDASKMEDQPPKPSKGFKEAKLKPVTLPLAFKTAGEHAALSLTSHHPLAPWRLRLIEVQHFFLF
jgi:hypothetical protein